MSVRTKLASKKEFRCAECSKGIVRPIAVGGRQANYRTLTLPVPAALEIPTCGNCGTEWINDSVARKLDTALEKEFRSRMRELVTVSLARLSELSISKASVERVLGLSQGYLSHLTTTGDKTPSEALASDLALLAQDPQRIHTIETLWKKLSGSNPDPAGVLGWLSTAA